MLTQQVPWSTLVTSRLITDADLQLLQRYDKKDEDEQKRLLNEVRAAKSELSPRSGQCKRFESWFQT